MRWAILVLMAGAFAAPAAAYDFVSIQDRELVLRAFVARPAGAAPTGAVVALHGCAGLGVGGEAIAPLYRAWAERLVEAGYAVILPDSFASRNVGSQCNVRDRKVRPRFERVRDANAARRWLQAQPWVRPDRVFLIGWSHGASTALWAVRPQIATRTGDRDFRSVVAFYPSCMTPTRTAWSARVPTLILIGAADDWTPARACEAMIEGARGRSAKVDVITYPGAHHAFDHPDLPLRLRTGLAYTPDGSGKAHEGSDPDARADSIKRVLEWLGR